MQAQAVTPKQASVQPAPALLLTKSIALKCRSTPEFSIALDPNHKSHARALARSESYYRTPGNVKGFGISMPCWRARGQVFEANEVQPGDAGLFAEPAPPAKRTPSGRIVWASAFSPTKG